MGAQRMRNPACSQEFDDDDSRCCRDVHGGRWPDTAQRPEAVSAPSSRRRGCIDLLASGVGAEDLFCGSAIRQMGIDRSQANAYVLVFRS